MATSNTKLIHEGIKMNYSNNDMTMLGNEYWQKKNFLDHLCRST